MTGSSGGSLARRVSSLVQFIQRLGCQKADGFRMLREEGLQFREKCWHLRIRYGRCLLTQFFDSLLD